VGLAVSVAAGVAVSVGNWSPAGAVGADVVAAAAGCISAVTGAAVAGARTAIVGAQPATATAPNTIIKYRLIRRAKSCSPNAHNSGNICAEDSPETGFCQSCPPTRGRCSSHKSKTIGIEFFPHMYRTQLLRQVMSFLPLYA
jgi:hypothetical protein